MPPQNQKQIEKIVNDNTFGMKNKSKSKTTQKLIQGIVKQCQVVNEFELKEQQKKEEEQKALMAALYKTVDTSKTRKIDLDQEDVDPKSIVCAYFQQGLCQKGQQCKYSHDLSMETQSEEIDIYTDQRSQFNKAGPTDEDESSENWTKQQLESVAKAQESQYKNQKPTEIVCQYFLDAIEKGKYGWKWMCPNGMICHYRHCLPPGYTMRKDVAQEKTKGDGVAIEQLIDDEISGLSRNNRTPVTLERFLDWKEQRRIRQEKEAQDKIKEEEKGKNSKIKSHLGLTGRALFKFDPTIFIDDEQALEEQELQTREENDLDDDELEETKEETQNDYEQDQDQNLEGENDQNENENQGQEENNEGENQQNNNQIDEGLGTQNDSNSEPKQN